MTPISDGRNLFAMMVCEDGSISIHEQEISKSVDIQDLLRSGLAAVDFSLVSPGVKLRLLLNQKEIAWMKRIITASYNGVWIGEVIKDVPLSRLKDWHIKYGIIRIEKRNKSVYLKF